MTFTGVISPLATPFVEDGSAVDEEALRRLIDAQIEDGVSGLIACGTTGEFSAMTRQERELVTEVAVEHAAGRVPVLVQTGSTSTEEAVALSVHAHATGAAGLLVPPPYYGSLTDAEIVTYYGRIARRVDLPICVYNIPAATGVGIATDLLVELAKSVPNVMFVKDSTGDLAQQTVLLQDYSDVVTFLCGEELLVAPGLLLGLRGAVLGCANIVGAGVVQLMDAGARGDFNEVARINAALMPLMQFIVTHPYVATVKAAMEIAGVGIGPVRQPLLPITDEERAELAALLSRIDPALLAHGTKVA
jgi:4-hydroxy-tetrahydrodipicolinate synthase